MMNVCKDDSLKGSANAGTYSLSATSLNNNTGNKYKDNERYSGEECNNCYSDTNSALVINISRFIICCRNNKYKIVPATLMNYSLEGIPITLRNEIALVRTCIKRSYHNKKRWHIYTFDL